MKFSGVKTLTKMKLVREKIRLPGTYSLTLASQKVQAGLLKLSGAVKAVTCPDEQTFAVTTGQSIRQHLNAVEQVRKDLTSPLLEAQRALKGMADKHCEPLKAELQRLEGLVSSFQIAEQKRVEEEQRRRDEEAKRLDRERFEAEKEAERLRVDGQVAAADQMEAVVEQRDEAWRNSVTAPLPEVSRARGSATKTVMRWKVTNIHKLYATHPELCNPPTPRPSAIQQLCVVGQEIEGLELWEEIDTTIRSR